MGHSGRRPDARWLAASVLLSAVACSDRTTDTDAAPPFDLVVRNVTLIDGTEADPQPETDVFVRDGRIARIDASPSPASAKASVDGTGRFLIPGLIDAHVHPFPYEETFPQFVHYGVTSIFVPGCSSCSDENLAAMRDYSASAAVAPRVFHTSQHFTMEGRHPVKTYPSASWVEGETVHYVRSQEQIETLVRRVASQPILGIKVTIENGPAPPFVERIPTAFVAKIVEEAHEAGLRVFAHVDDIEEVRIAEEAGVDHLLHFVGVRIDWPSDRPTLERLLAREVSWVTTLMVDKGLFYPAYPAWLDAIAGEGVYDAAALESLRSAISAEQALERLRRIYGEADPTPETILRPQVEDLHRLHEMGFNLVLGTDTTNRFIFPGHSLHEEMQLLARVFEPADLLRMATRNAATMLGLGDELGTLEVGKRADMVLLDADPTADIANTRSIRAVFRDGRSLDPGFERRHAAVRMGDQSDGGR